MADSYVNAVVEITVPLDGVSVDDGKVAKRDAAARTAVRILNALPEDLQDSLCASRWEDVADGR